MLTRDERIAEHIRMAVIEHLESCSRELDHLGVMVTKVRRTVSNKLPGAAEDLDSGLWDTMIRKTAESHYSKGAWPQKLAFKDKHLSKETAKHPVEAEPAKLQTKGKRKRGKS